MGSSTINTENGEDTTSASSENKIERLDARMSQFDVRCTQIEGTLQELSAAKDPATPLTPRALKRGRFSSSEDEGDLEGVGS